MISEDESEPPGRSENKRVFEFDEFSFDASDKVLWSGERLVSLPPKTCELLSVFVENAGRLISKDELMRTVWEGTFVEEANLSHHIAVLRRSLGESRSSGRFIETVQRKGYRFVAPVSRTTRDTLEITVNERTTMQVFEEVEVEISPAETRAGEQKVISQDKISGPSTPFPKRTVMYLLLTLLSALGIAIFAWLKLSPTASSEQVANRKSQIADRMTIARITNSGKVGAVSISPDGKFIAYLQNYTDGVGTVYIRQTDTNIENRLVTYEKGEFGMTAFSTDGAFVIYAARHETHPDFSLYRVPITGGTPARLIEKLGAKHFALSPDGTEIVVVRYQEEKQSSLVAIRLDGTESERVLITRPMQEMAFLSGGTWSPDGQKIVLPVKTMAATNNYSQSIVNVMAFDLATGELRDFTDETWSDFGIMRWMPDSSGVVVIGTRPQLRNQIYFIANPSGEVSRITNDANGYGNYGLGITKDGSRLVADVWEFEGRIWTVDASGDMKTAALLPSGNATLSSGLTTLPDGQIIFGTRTNFGYDIWTMRETDAEAKPLTSDAFYDNRAVAAPDGSFIVFVSDRAGVGTQHLFRMNADGSQIGQLTFGDGNDDAPDISPDGKWIIYYSDVYDTAKGDMVKTIRKMPVSGGPAVGLMENCFVPAFSPDSQRFACLAPVDNYHGKIIVGMADDGQMLKSFEVDIFHHTLLSLRWTPDGTGVVFRNVINQTGNLWKQDLAGGAPIRLTDFKSENIFSFTFSRNGKRILLARGNALVNVVMFKNFR